MKRKPEKREFMISDRLVGLVVSMSDYDHEVAGSIPDTSTDFKCRLGLDRGPAGLVRTIG